MGVLRYGGCKERQLLDRVKGYREGIAGNQEQGHDQRDRGAQGRA